MSIKDISGNKYGKLLAIKYVKTEKGRAFFECLCDCGNTCVLKGKYLINGDTKSCGCASYKRGKDSHFYVHGLKHAREYSIWSGMKTRVSNPNQKSYRYYGRKGIKICERWLVFSNFLEDMGKCPRGMSLDRIDSNGDYCKENCRWVDKITQMNNTSRNHAVTIGNATKNISEWAREYGVSKGCILHRVSVGKTAEELLKPSRVQHYTCSGLVMTITEWCKFLNISYHYFHKYKNNLEEYLVNKIINELM